MIVLQYAHTTLYTHIPQSLGSNYEGDEEPLTLCFFDQLLVMSIVVHKSTYLRG